MCSNVQNKAERKTSRLRQINQFATLAGHSISLWLYCCSRQRRRGFCFFLALLFCLSLVAFLRNMKSVCWCETWSSRRLFTTSMACVTRKGKHEQNLNAPNGEANNDLALSGGSRNCVWYNSMSRDSNDFRILIQGILKHARLFINFSSFALPHRHRSSHHRCFSKCAPAKACCCSMAKRWKFWATSSYLSLI